MKKLQNLPVGNSSFEIIRQNHQLYVDKTRHIFKLVNEGMYYFMSRPRRFGKSLLISTLKCLFEGKKKLFNGLWITDNTEWEWKQHPVIQIDFNGISHDKPENLKQGLESRVRSTGELYGIQLKESLLKELFKELILALNIKTGMPVVILVDEYDKPLIDHLGRGREALETAKANRDILKYFFGVIKDGTVSSALRFVFLTGVSKFSRVSIFSELNNLLDITMNKNYADMFGYTHKELTAYFPPYIKVIAEDLGFSESDMLKALTVHYDGYRFSKKEIRVYNPYSILCAFMQKELNHFWFETGTPTFLVNLLKESGFSLPQIEGMQSVESVFSMYELEDLKPEALLFQTGYVTIKDVKNRLYTFGYPNREVKTAFLEALLHSFIKSASDRSRFVLLAEYLYMEDYDSFIETAQAIFASIVYEIETKRDEAYFHTLFYLMVCASGIDANSEVMTSKGRIDLVMAFSDKIYIIEFKCNQSADKALRQIHEKEYAQKYRQRGKKIVLMGINFDTEKRNISEWKQEAG